MNYTEEEIREIGRFAYTTRVDRAPDTFGFLERQSRIIGAAFRQESPLFNMIPRARPLVGDSTFDPLPLIYENPLTEGYESRLIGARTREEFDEIMLQIEKEKRDRAVLENGGMAGVLWAMAGGLASPTTVIPLIGWARVVSAGAPVLQAGAVTGLNAAAAIAIDEAVLGANQITRTFEESMTNVLVGSLFGAALGAGLTIPIRARTALMRDAAADVRAALSGDAEAIERMAQLRAARVAETGGISSGVAEDLIIYRDEVLSAQREPVGPVVVDVDDLSGARIGLSAQVVQRPPVEYAGDFVEVRLIPKRWWGFATETSARALSALGDGLTSAGYDRFGNYFTSAAARVEKFDPKILTRMLTLSPALGPSVRAALREYPLRAQAAFQQAIATSGAYFDTPKLANSKYDLRRAVSRNGRLEDIKLMLYNKYVAQLNNIVMEAYATHRGIPLRAGAVGQSLTAFQTEMAAVATNLRVGNKAKLSSTEFNKLIWWELASPGFKQVPEEVKKAAAAIRETIYQPLADLAVGAKLEGYAEGVSEKTLAGDKGFTPRVNDRNAVEANPADFEHGFITFFLNEELQKWGKKLDQALRKAELAEAELAGRNVAPEDAARMREEIKQEIERLSHGPVAQALADYNMMMNDAKKLKEAGYLEAARATYARARKLKNDIPAIQELINRKKLLSTKRAAINKGQWALRDRELRAIEKADKLAEQAENVIIGAASKLNELNNALKGARDEKVLESLRESIQKELAKLEDKIAATEQELATLAQKHPELVEAPEEWTRRLQRFRRDLFKKTGDEKLGDFSWVSYGEGGHQYITLRSAQDRDELLSLLRFAQARGDFNQAQKKALQNWAAEIERLHWTNETALAKASARFDLEMGRAVRAQAKYDKLAKKLEKIEDPAKLSEELEKALRGYAKDKLSIIRTKLAREAELRQRAERLKKINGIEWERETARLAGARVDIMLDLKKRAEDAGYSFDPETLVFDIETKLRAEASAFRNAVVNGKVYGPGIDLSKIDDLLVRKETGSALARQLKIPMDYEFTSADGLRKYNWGDFYLKDPVRTAPMYMQALISNSLISLRFNDGNGTNLARWFDDKEGEFAKELQLRTFQIQNDLDANGNPLENKLTPEQKNNLIRQLNKDYADNNKQLAFLLEDLRGNIGVTDPNSFFARFVAAWRNLNVANLMGMVVPSSLPELFMPMIKVGMRPYFADSVAALTKDFQGFLRAAEMAQAAGQGLDRLTSMRFVTAHDVAGFYGRQTGVERLIEWLAHKTGSIAGFNIMTDFTKMLAAPAILAQLARAIELKVTGNTPSVWGYRMSMQEAEDILAHAGFDDDLLERVWGELTAVGKGQRTWAGALDLTNVFDWGDAGAQNAILLTLQHRLSQTTVTPGMERFRFMRETPAGQAIWQFRSFGVSSYLRNAVPLMQRPDAEKMMVLPFLMIGGYAAYQAAVLSHGPGSPMWERAKNATPAEVLDEVIDRSGILFLGQELKNILQQTTIARDMVQFGEASAGRVWASSLAGAIAGPSIGTLGRAATLGTANWEEGLTEGEINKIRSLMPYNNVFWLRALYREAFDLATQPIQR